MDNCEREMTLEERCQELRIRIESVKSGVCSVFNGYKFREGDDILQGANIPSTRNANMKANLTLAFRHLEDARMRLGKAMQAYQGGISCLDKK